MDLHLASLEGSAGFCHNGLLLRGRRLMHGFCRVVLYSVIWIGVYLDFLLLLAYYFGISENG